MIYTLAIHLYALLVELLSPFHKKARMMRFGQWKTNAILREQIDRKARYIWFHASSLGEFEQGRPMMEKIKELHPQYKILLTFFSPSGYEVRKNYPGADVICYLPFDTPYKVRKFIHLANPCMAIFIKYEFWANYLSELKRRQIPVYSISAIFRRRQLFFRWYGRPYLKTLHCFDHLFVQDAASADLLAAHGIRHVTVSGDTRFDRVMDVQKHARPVPLVEAFVKGADGEKRTTLVAGSSWPRDEELFIRYFNEHPEIKLIIAPHEIDRGHLLEIHARLKRPSVRFSDACEKDVAGKDCLIIDSFGLLSSIYRYGDIAYIGGGFGKGIHNILEAAVYGIPVLFGPAHHKFKEARDLIAAGGAFPISDETTFRAQM
ncbi:MAG: 3-deoxy-D-manno-octulosonic acid transferase, partial [Tannerellaceae bacterium]|nr:3-deoxy-D-manno-octulosonic acid transferase [Tannerellaceae bacterium]